MHRFVGPQLAAMMFLQFFVWGAWYVTAYLFLGKIGFGGEEIGWTYSVGPIAGIVSPFFVGMVADRFFSTEKILGVLHLLGAAVMCLATFAMTTDNPSPMLINCILFGYMLCYFPTLSLTNSLAMHNLDNSEKQFPLIRVFGTIGWIIPGIIISKMNWDDNIQPFQLSAGCSAVLGLYCFSLPHTPPPLAGKAISVREILGLDALVLLKRPSFLTFMISSFLICIPLAFYYQLATKFIMQSGIENPAFKMSFGQMSEIFFMVVMPLFFARLGVKKMLLVGMFAWAVRYGLFAFGADAKIEWMLLAGILLHGICYDFFFVTGQIYTDKIAPASIRGQAQGMLVLFTLGLGMLIGAQVAGQVEVANTTGEGDSAVVAWKQLWLLPTVAAAGIMVLFAIVFRDDVPVKQITEEDVARGLAAEEFP
jgi:nucleoside transporter